MNNPQRVAMLATLAAGLSLTAIPSANAASRNYEAGVCLNGSGFDYGYATVAGYNQNNKYVRTPAFRLGKSCGYKSHWWYKPNQTLSVTVRKAHSSVWYQFYPNFSHCKVGSNKSVRYCWVA